MPDLARRAAPARPAPIDPVRRTSCRAIYWDTSDLRLAREGITLRHRSGEGADKDGWHLKLPSCTGPQVPDASTVSRDELARTAAAETPIPDELRDLVLPWSRTAVLGPVATLVTQRTAYLLRDAAGNALVELTDDLVSVLSSGHVAGRFREIEVEDRGGGLAAIEAVGGRAAGAAARSAASSCPKVVRALGPQATRRPRPAVARQRSASTSRRAVRCATCCDATSGSLIALDVSVRRDSRRRGPPDAGHGAPAAQRPEDVPAAARPGVGRLRCASSCSGSPTPSAPRGTARCCSTG